MISTPTVALLLAVLAAPASAPGTTSGAGLPAPEPARSATGAGLAVATAAAERLPLPAGVRPPVRIDALGHTLFLPAANPVAAARSLVARNGAFCPKVEAVGGGVRLDCRTRRIAAAVIVDRKGAALELRELRGIPWRANDDGPPRFPWDPVALGGGACPGATPAAMGECALGGGDLAAAAAHFQAAAEGAERPWAAVRLGDLALAEDRLEDAIGWWNAAGDSGIFARLAIARVCEVTGNCFDDPRFAARFDPAGLPWPLGTELTLRAVRVEAFLGRSGAAARRLLGLAPAERAAACVWSRMLCHRIALEALREAKGSDREDALALYLSLADHDRGPLAVELARAGAEAAASLGARVFGGNLLSSVAAQVPPDELADHLLRSAELFVAGRDPVRAGVILEFARTRLPAARLAEARWAAVVTAVTGSASAPSPAPGPEADPDLERARAVLGRARAATPATPPRGR